LLVAGGALAGAAVVGSAVAIKLSGGEADTPTARPKVDRLPPAAETFDGQTSTAWTDVRELRVQARTPAVLGSVENLNLTADPFWVECHLVPKQQYRVRALVKGGNNTPDNAVVVQLSGASGGSGLSLSPVFGAFFALRSGPGHYWTDHIFTVTKPVTKYGFLIPAGRGAASLKTFAIEAISVPNTPVDCFISIDCEADVNRAPTDTINRLVWGKLPGGEYGIRRLVSIFDQHKIKVNFMVDFGSCLREGPAQMHAIADFLGGTGHEIHMHLHTEDLTRRLHVPADATFRFEKASYEMSRRLLSYTADRYVEYIGGTPRVFRSGAYMMDEELVVAAGTVGIKLLTNVKEGAIGSASIGGDAPFYADPFVWDNGVLELPVDVSSPETSETFVNHFNLAMQRKTAERTFNIVMHSWSLMRRNDAGLHDTFGPELEEAIHKICEHMKSHGVLRGYNEFLDTETKVPRPVVSTMLIRPEPLTGPPPSTNLLHCNICDMSFAKIALVSDTCPACGSNPRHRQLKSALAGYIDSIAGCEVLALDADRLKLLGLLASAKKVQRFPKDNATKSFEAGSFGCVIGLQLVNDRTSAEAVVADIARILKPGGVFISSITYRSAEGSVPLQRYLDVLSQNLVVTSVPAYDPVTETSGRIFFAAKENPG